MELLLILDIDGTLSDNVHRAHLVECDKPDWEAFLKPELVAKDPPILDAVRCIRHFQNLGAEIVFLTGRREPLRDTTREWIFKYFDINATSITLFMRQSGNSDKPTVLKNKIIQELIIPQYRDHTMIAIEDDPYMQQIYFQNGIIPLQAPGCWKTIFSFDKSLPAEEWLRR